MDHSRRISELSIQHRTAKQTAERESAALEKSKQQEQTIVSAQQIITAIAQTIQQKVHSKIADVVTRCLNAVFDDPYEFRIDFQKKRGKTEANLTFVRDGLTLSDPLNEIGGGVIDIAALALRVAAVILSRPPLSRVIFLDESFRNVRGESHKQRTRNMLQSLATELHFQFILNTDIPAYRMGPVVEMG
jgi:hypothetical protein